MEKSRLLREVADADCSREFFSKGVVAILDRENNLIRVRQGWWREQPMQVQREVWKMDVAYLAADDFMHFAHMECA